MIFLELFWTFTKIGIVNFGGGYAMLSLIQAEVVAQHGWLTMEQFTDIVAISQMTPGPIGINAATFVGYDAVVSAGYSPILGVLGSLIATLSVVWLPFLLMVVLGFIILRNREKPFVKGVFAALRPTVVGLIAAAALLLCDEANFGNPNREPFIFALSLIIFSVAFVMVYRYKQSPLKILGACLLLGFISYPFFC